MACQTVGVDSGTSGLLTAVCAVASVASASVPDRRKAAAGDVWRKTAVTTRAWFS